jgi:hypothetical protein
MTRYTLVRHSGYSAGANPKYEQAVEAREVDERVANTVRAAGGLLFESREAAVAAADAANHPAGSIDVAAEAPGHFSNVRIEGAEIYIPR